MTHDPYASENLLPSSLSEQAEQAATHKSLSDQQIEDDMKWLMSSKRGRRFAHMVMDFAGVYRTSMTGDNWTFFNEGQRNVGSMIQARINVACPEKLVEMMKEHKTNG